MSTQKTNIGKRFMGILLTIGILFTGVSFMGVANAAEEEISHVNLLVCKDYYRMWHVPKIESNLSVEVGKEGECNSSI